jgi:hypothetical protein
MIYPNSSPEFRILKTVNGDSLLQVRYINLAMGYTGKWMAVQTEREEETHD